MANVEQFEKVVTEAGAVAMRIMRGPKGSGAAGHSDARRFDHKRSPVDAAISAKTFRPPRSRPRKSSPAPNALQPPRATNLSSRPATDRLTENENLSPIASRAPPTLTALRITSTGAAINVIRPEPCNPLSRQPFPPPIPRNP